MEVRCYDTGQKLIAVANSMGMANFTISTVKQQRERTSSSLYLGITILNELEKFGPNPPYIVGFNDTYVVLLNIMISRNVTLSKECLYSSECFYSYLFIHSILGTHVYLLLSSEKTKFLARNASLASYIGFYGKIYFTYYNLCLSQRFWWTHPLR